jgi:glycosyltransferase involved in cell wall biosynthesis
VRTDAPPPEAPGAGAGIRPVRSATVLICTYNRAALLARTLGGLAGQRTSPGLVWEIVVVDNNSRDGTKDVVEAFRAGAPAPTTYLFDGRQGKSFALNTGLDVAAGDVIAFTDDDCLPEASWLQDTIEAMVRWNADGLGGRIVPAWSRPPAAWLAHERHLWDTLALLPDDQPRRVQDGAWERQNGFRVWGANMAFRRDVFDTIGVFDTGMGPRGDKKYSLEEIDLVKRALTAGKTIVYDPTPTVHHWVPPHRMRRAFFRKHSFDYGEGLALHQGLPRGRHLFGLPGHLVLGLGRHLTACARAALTRDAEAFCCQRDIFEDLGYAWGYLKGSLRRGELLRLRKG